MTADTSALSGEFEFDELAWPFKQLLRKGYSRDHILAELKGRFAGRRGRPEVEDEDDIARIGGKLTAGKAAAGNDSVRRRLALKMQRIGLRRRYQELIEEIAFPWWSATQAGDELVMAQEIPPEVRDDAVEFLYREEMRASLIRKLGPFALEADGELREKWEFLISRRASSFTAITEKLIADLEALRDALHAKAGEKSKRILSGNN